MTRQFKCQSFRYCIRTLHPRLIFFLLLTFLISGSLEATTGEENPGPYSVGRKTLTFVDKTRSIKPTFNFPGSDERRIDVVVRYPIDKNDDGTVQDADVADGGPWPLIVYAHGTYGFPDNATHFVDYLVQHGYVIVAPAFPLTSRAAFTKVPAPDITDTPNQPKDVEFVIDQMLADKEFGPVIDRDHIACSGHSLGAVTCYFAAFGRQTRVPRITATVLIGAGDPVQAALASDFGFDGVAYAPVSVPTLFLTADKDIFAGLGGRPGAAYSRIQPPKYEVIVKGGSHVWFRDGMEQPADGKNPDCLFFEKNMPGTVIPGCDEPGGLIDPAVQQRITRVAMLDFLDGYFKGNADALEKLRNLGEAYKEAEVNYED